MNPEAKNTDDTPFLRALTFVLKLPDGSRPTSHVFNECPNASREQIYHLNVLENGSIVLLARIRGDLDCIRKSIEDEPPIINYHITEEDPEHGLMFLQTHPPEEVAEILDLPSKHKLFIDFPVEGTADENFRVTVIGETNETLRKALADVPEGVEVSVERIGEYPDQSGDITAVLTDRQEDVLQTALELGYYDVPRKATHQDIAEELDLSVGTVGEHLQKIEHRVFHHFFR